MGTNKTFVLISPKNRTAYNFRGDLIREIIKRGYTVYVTGPNKIDVDRIEELGAKFKLIPNNKNGVNVFSDLTYLFRLWRFMRKVKPDVTLGYTVKPVIYGAIAAKLAGVRSINSMITGVGYLFISKALVARLLKQLVIQLYIIGLRVAHSVIFQNEDDLNEFIDNGVVKKGKTNIVNGSGVNMERFTVHNLPQQLTFFMLSRVMYAKGVMEYAKAAKIIKERHPNIRFMLLGAFEDIQDSIPKGEFMQEYVDSGVLDYFEESNNIASYYAQCSVFVLPSYREGTPRTVLEAMAMGRAIITTDVPGCRQTVIDGEGGFKVPVKDVDALVEAMEKFIHNQNLAKEMGAASYKYCASKYCVELVNKSMMDIMFKNIE